VEEVDEDEDPQLAELVKRFRLEQEAVRSQYPSTVVVNPIFVLVTNPEHAELVAQAIEKVFREKNSG
jgi:DNA repair photolyase